MNQKYKLGDKLYYVAYLGKPINEGSSELLIADFIVTEISLKKIKGKSEIYYSGDMKYYPRDSSNWLTEGNVYDSKEKVKQYLINQFKEKIKEIEHF